MSKQGFRTARDAVEGLVAGLVMVEKTEYRGLGKHTPLPVGEGESDIPPGEVSEKPLVLLTTVNGLWG